MQPPLPGSRPAQPENGHDPTPPDAICAESLDDIARLAASLCDTPIAGVCLVPGAASAVGGIEAEALRNSSFCTQTAAGPDLFVVRDALADERFARDAAVTSDPPARFYAGAPLMAPEGRKIGTLCVLDHVPRELNPGQAEALRALGRHIVRIRHHLTETEHSLAGSAERIRTLEQAVEQYRAVVENAVEGIFRTSPEGRFLTANPMLAHIYGYATPGEMMAAITDIAHQVYVDPERRTAFMRLLQEQDAVFDFESRVFRKDGSTIWIRENARAVRDVAGVLLGYEGTVEDITARKRAEEERARALEALGRARAELETRVSERTAELASANEALEVAHQKVLEAAAEKRRFYREVIRCVSRDKFHLVDASEIPAEGRLVREAPLETMADYPALRQTLREVAEGQGMSADAARDLVLAVGEAATNAIHHGAQGRCAIFVTPERLIARVSDHGAGIRSEDLPATIFQPGFSTKISLGMGYTLMIELVDRVWLATESEGTVVQLEKWVHPEEHAPQIPSFGKL